MRTKCRETEVFITLTAKKIGLFFKSLCHENGLFIYTCFPPGKVDGTISVDDLEVIHLIFQNHKDYPVRHHLYERRDVCTFRPIWDIISEYSH